MKVYLAGIESIYSENRELFYKGYNLASFYSINEMALDIAIHSSEFLLDSGAYTFMVNSKTKKDWDSYVSRYAEFVAKNRIEHFFELDIDNVVGYEEVLRLREKLEIETGRRCIPVWHKTRGIQEFLKMIDEYSYVAIGGIISREITKDQYCGFAPLIKEAHKKNCKIHGLGFTSINLLDRYPFDSVDSTNWSFGRYGHFWRYKDGKIKMYHRPDGKHCVNRAGIQAHNIKEWIKFQRYAERNL